MCLYDPLRLRKFWDGYGKIFIQGIQILFPHPSTYLGSDRGLSADQGDIEQVADVTIHMPVDSSSVRILVASCFLLFRAAIV